jgi:hypothetical protein
MYYITPAEIIPTCPDAATIEFNGWNIPKYRLQKPKIYIMPVSKRFQRQME